MDDFGQYYLVFCTLSFIPSVIITLLTYSEISKDEPKRFWRVYTAINMIVLMTCLWPVVLLGFIPYEIQMRKIRKMQAAWDARLQEMQEAHDRFSNIIVLDATEHYSGSDNPGFPPFEQLGVENDSYE